MNETGLNQQEPNMYYGECDQNVLLVNTPSYDTHPRISADNPVATGNPNASFRNRNLGIRECETIGMEDSQRETSNLL
jgi:hypothetical protein